MGKEGIVPTYFKSSEDFRHTSKSVRVQLLALDLDPAPTDIYDNLRLV